MTRTTDSPNRRGTASFAAVARRVAALLALLVVAPLPAQGVPLRLDWTLDFSYPPNPCIAGSSLVSGSLGLFAAPAGADGDTPLTPGLGLPDLPCGASGGGSAWFDADDGVAIFGAYSGAVRLLNPDAADQPVYAFPNGTTLIDSDPGDAPLVLLGEVCGSVFCPDPGQSELPFFAFASPGTQIGTLTLAIAAVPEPAPWTLLLLVGGGWWGCGLWRSRATPSRQM